MIYTFKRGSAKYQHKNRKLKNMWRAVHVSQKLHFSESDN